MGKDFFGKLSDSLNQYEGMRANAALDVYAGPSPRDMMPPPLETRDAEGPLDEDALWEMLQNMPEGVTREGEAAEAILEEEQQAWETPLDPVVLEGNIEADTSDEFSARRLLAAMERLPEHIAHHKGVQELFTGALRDALEDLRGYAQRPRTGRAGDIVQINGNTLRLLIQVTEQPGPPQSRVAAQLFINER